MYELNIESSRDQYETKDKETEKWARIDVSTEEL